MSFKYRKNVARDRSQLIRYALAARWDHDDVQVNLPEAHSSSEVCLLYRLFVFAELGRRPIAKLANPELDSFQLVGNRLFGMAWGTDECINIAFEVASQRAERFRSADDPQQVKQLGDELGRFVFGE